MLCFLGFLSSSNASTMLNEEETLSNASSRSLIKVESVESYDIELTPFIGGGNEEEESHLYSFIHKYLVQQESIPESKLKKILRSGAQGICVVLGSSAGVPYFQIARQAGGGNGILAWGMGITNTIATSGTGAWAYFNLLEGFDPQSDEEKILLQKSKLPLPGHLASHTLGLVVAVPTAYMASLYNTHKWLAGISYGLDYSLKTNGYLNFFKSLTAQESKVKSCIGGSQENLELESYLQNIQQLLIHHLSRKTISALLTMSNEERDNFITSIYQEENLTVENYLKSMLSLNSSNPPSRETPDTWKKGYPKIAFVSGLSLSAVINIFHNGYCAYKGWEFLYENPNFDIPMAVITTIPIFILELQATIQTGRSLYDAAFYRISGDPQPSLLHSLYPKFSRVLPYLCIPLAGVTAYVGRFMVVDIIQEVLPQQEYSLFFAVGGFMGPFLFSAYTNYSLIEDLLLKYTRSFGENSKKKLALLIQGIEKLTKIISLTPKEEIKEFIEHPNIQSSMPMLNGEDVSEETLKNPDQNQETDLGEAFNKKSKCFSNQSKCILI